MTVKVVFLPYPMTGFHREYLIAAWLQVDVQSPHRRQVGRRLTIADERILLRIAFCYCSCSEVKLYGVVAKKKERGIFRFSQLPVGGSVRERFDEPSISHKHALESGPEQHGRRSSAKPNPSIKRKKMTGGGAALKLDKKTKTGLNKPNRRDEIER